MLASFTIKSTVHPDRIIKGFLNDSGIYEARLYTNNGNTACRANKIAKKKVTLLKWAQELLASPVLNYEETLYT